MKSRVFHLPEHCREVTIEGKCSSDCLDTEKSAGELKDILAEDLPSGMYLEFAEKIVGEYLEKNCDVPTLEKLKEAMDSSKISYAKNFDLYRIVKRITNEKREE
ncbi:MAG: hypothetical protein WC511_00200 [Candidatus Pacearchaeota archaeon]